jgi:ribosome biogenesis GTPase A
VQWYPGHIGKAERALKEQLSSVDLVLEVRDGRIPMSTRHPQLPEWSARKPRVLLLNRLDMVPQSMQHRWKRFFKERGLQAHWTVGNSGDGVHAVSAQSPIPQTPGGAVPRTARR